VTSPLRFVLGVLLCPGITFSPHLDFESLPPNPFNGPQLSRVAGRTDALFRLLMTTRESPVFGTLCAIESLARTRDVFQLISRLCSRILLKNDESSQVPDTRSCQMAIASRPRDRPSPMTSGYGSHAPDAGLRPGIRSGLPEGDRVVFRAWGR
jgi:hypothetical protein